MSMLQGCSAMPSTAKHRLVPLKKPRVASKLAVRTDGSLAYTSYCTCSGCALSQAICQRCLSCWRTGTPTLIFTDGTRVPGAVSTAEIEKRLVAAAAGDAAAK